MLLILILLKVLTVYINAKIKASVKEYPPNTLTTDKLSVLIDKTKKNVG